MVIKLVDKLLQIIYYILNQVFLNYSHKTAGVSCVTFYVCGQAIENFWAWVYHTSLDNW